MITGCTLFKIDAILIWKVPETITNDANVFRRKYVDMITDFVVSSVSRRQTRPEAVRVRKMGRGSGWTDSEDECLAKAWLWGTGDAINGTFQDAQSFWDKVTQNYRSRVGFSTSERSSASIKNRWNQILRREVHKLISIRDDIESLNPTGTADEDRMAMAVRRYCGIDLYERTRSGRFPHMGAYLFLKGCPKFTSLLSTPTKQAAITGPGNESAATAQNPQQAGSFEGISVDETLTKTTSVLSRPQGRKAAKTEKRESQVERLARGSEQHAKSLDRIAQGLEVISKRKRADMLMSLSEDELSLLAPGERERVKRTRTECTRLLLKQVEKDFGISPTSAEPKEGSNYVEGSAEEEEK
jgi:hypothetical protein